MPRARRIPPKQHDSKTFTVGDWVVIKGFNSYWDGCEGQVAFVDVSYCYLKGSDYRLRGYDRQGAGFQSGLLIFIESEYEAAVKILGEDYFA